MKALRDYDILDSAAEQVFDDLTAVAAYICDVPMATISLVDEHRQWFKSRIGIAEVETPRDVAFCAHTVLGSEPMVVDDAMSDPRFAVSPLVTAGPEIRFYAGFPLTTQDGLSVGALCAIDRKPRSLDAAQRSAMAALARQVMALFEMRRVSRQLAEALGRVKTLEGLLPICAWCKRIRDSQGDWRKLEHYIMSRSDASFTHGICPTCMAEVRAGKAPVTNS